MFAAEILRKRCFVGGAQGNVKALLRKGTALLTMQEYADAIAALTQVRQKPKHRRHHTVAQLTSIGGKILCLLLCTCLLSALLGGAWCRQAIEAEPENRAVKKALAQAEAKAKKSKQTERNMAKKMAKAFG